jgi:hypothetical protein
MASGGTSSFLIARRRKRRSPLCHKLLGDARFHALQLKLDEDLAEETRAARCRVCGGRLDSAKFPRKPRGTTTALPAGYELRFSFCCATCRTRHTAPSMRYLGRKVYLGAVVVLATAMQHGPTPSRAAHLQRLFGVSLRTLARWRDWWRTTFAQSPFWKRARGLLVRPVSEQQLPLSLLACFAGDEEAQLVALLKLLLPISTPSARGAMPI